MWRFILPAAIAIALVVVVWRWVRRLRQEYYVTEYLFFIRYPVVLAAVLFFFPILAPRAAPEMFGSLFVLRPFGIAAVVFCACMATWLIVYSAYVLWYSTPFRADLKLRRHAPETEITPAIPGKDGEILLDPQAFFYLALVLPLVGTLIARVDGSMLFATLAALGGLVAAVAFRNGVSRLAPRAKKLARRKHARASGDRSKETGTTGEPNVAAEAAPALTTARERYFLMLKRVNTFGLASVAIYAATGIAGGFVRTDFSAGIPAVLFLLATLLVVNWAAAFLSFEFDKFRVPVVSLVVVLALIWKSVWPSDHTYNLAPWNGPAAKDVRDVLNDFATTRDGKLVVVAASGGGITAALWTANVLRALDSLGKSTDTTFDFSSHVALVSSVSGGSVGAMYYVNAFGPSRRPERSLDSIVVASRKSSLSAAAWGMMYPDFFRIIMGEALGRFDRAWAQERRWESSLGAPDAATPTLASWAAGVRDGWRPIQIFNATIEETGERMLIAPARLALADTANTSPALWREFQRLYPGSDVDVVTAARLSATFPYVTPHARPKTADSLRNVAFHVADGGYYDNSGIVTALETISTWVNWGRYNQRARRIALIEIRAGGETGASVDKKPAAPLLHSLSGPFNTLFNVRTTSQVARNLQEISLVKRLWECNPQRPEFDHFVFRLSGDAPLSWHLTREEAGRIERHFGSPLVAADTLRTMVEARAQNDAEFARLARFLVSTAREATNRCPAGPA